MIQFTHDGSSIAPAYRLITSIGNLVSFYSDVQVDFSFSPTKSPTNSPTRTPSSSPTIPPSNSPTNQPSYSPTSSPSRLPTNLPTNTPSRSPTASPSNAPSVQPSTMPTAIPTRNPTRTPTASPSESPTQSPVRTPTVTPSRNPTHVPTRTPTASPSESPTQSPVRTPTLTPSRSPTQLPTAFPSEAPTEWPSENPTVSPINSPSDVPSEQPTHLPTNSPNNPPTQQPNSSPASSPSNAPITQPTDSPTSPPINSPTDSPSVQSNPRNNTEGLDENKVLAIALGTGLPISALLLTAIAYFLCCRKKPRNNEIYLSPIQTSSHSPAAETFALEIKEQEGSNPEEIHIPYAFCCPISLEIMEEPVLLVEEGITYESEQITRHLQEGNLLSPVKMRRLSQRKLVPNDAIKKAIQRFLNEYPWLNEPDRVTPDADKRYGAFLIRKQNEIQDQKPRRRALFLEHLERVKAYLEKCDLLGKHAGANNYDVFISYAWENQDKKKLEAHLKLQGFLDRLQTDLQTMGLKVFWDYTDMDRNMRAVMEESITQSGIILSICKPFLKQAVAVVRENNNIALEVDCALARAAHTPKSLLPLLCEGEWATEPELMAWILQFIKHLKLAGLKVSYWSGKSAFPQQIPNAVIVLCTPDLKLTMETSVTKEGSRWRQLQHHLAQPKAVCYPIVYGGNYGTAVPDWSKSYNGRWQKKNFLARNTDGNSLDASKPHYYELMMGIKPKGLLRDLLCYQDNDACYNFLYDNLQLMLCGWGTQALLDLEGSVDRQARGNPEPLPRTYLAPQAASLPSAAAVSNSRAVEGWPSLRAAEKVPQASQNRNTFLPGPRVRIAPAVPKIASGTDQSRIEPKEGAGSISHRSSYRV